MSERPHCLNRDACAAKGGGHCRQCWGKHIKAATMADPEIEARRRAKVSAILADTMAVKRQCPEWRKKLAKVARKHNVFQRPEVRAKAFSPEVVAKREQARIETVRSMDACERRRKFGTNKGFGDDLDGVWRSRYKALIAKRFSAAEARAMIDAEQAVIRRRIEASELEQRLRAEREKAQAY